MSIILDTIFPRCCYRCHSSGWYLCPECQEFLKCRPIKHSPTSRLDGTLSLFRYHSYLKAIIKDLKFGFVTDLIPEIISFTIPKIENNYPKLLRYWQENKFSLVPIPLHPFRHSWRGFNQSAEIGQKLSLKLNLSYHPEILTRVKNTLPQTKIRDKLVRRSNTSSSFRLCCDKYKNIILFDDVYTTGSTLSSAASVFPGDTAIWGFTLAG
jgi:ComF family protein